MTWPGTAPAWLLPWTIWRFRNREGPRPAGVPSTIPKWAWKFLEWCEWRRKGAIAAQRPEGLPVKIPQWAWAELKQLNQAVPLKPPPPPPPPPPDVPPSSWHLPNPLVFLTWGPTLDWQTSADFAAAMSRFAAAEAKTVAFQIGYGSGWQADIARSHGLRVCAWGVAGTTDDRALVELGAEGYMPQVEGLYERNPAIDNLRAGVGAGLSLALVTTMASLDQGEMAWFEAVGCSHAFVETYSQSGGNLGNIPTMMWQAAQYGIHHANPVPGIYWDVPLTSYDLSAYGDQIGVWSAEYFDAQDLADLKAL